MIPMKHGYTNDTTGDGRVVEKRYAGPDADLRRAREYAVLRELHGRLPVPPVRELAGETLRLGFVAGTPGQELLDAGPAEAVLAACGDVLGRIHATTIAALLPPSDRNSTDQPQPRGTFVHGDFGPNNLLLDPETFAVTAVVDWEFAHYGSPIEDLAWCEWIVRMHHPDQVDALAAFFAAYPGDVPPWPARQAAMVARCEDLRHFCTRWDPTSPAVTLWQIRTETTAAWTE